MNKKKAGWLAFAIFIFINWLGAFEPVGFGLSLIIVPATYYLLLNEEDKNEFNLLVKMLWGICTVAILIALLLDSL